MRRQSDSMIDEQSAPGSLQDLQSGFCWQLSGHGQVACSFLSVSTIVLFKKQIMVVCPKAGTIVKTSQQLQSAFSISLPSPRILVCIYSSQFTGSVWPLRSQTAFLVFSLAVRGKGPDRSWHFVEVRESPIFLSVQSSQYLETKQ